MAEKKFSEAVVQYRNAVSQDERFGEARSKLASAYASMGDGRNALREAVRAADLLPTDEDVQLRAGYLLLLARQFPEAKARALAALQKNPKNAGALILLGNATVGLRDLDTAIEQLEQAIDEAPELTLGYANLGAIYLAKGDREAAEATFRRAVTTSPDSVDAHLSLANFLWASGNQREAESSIKTALTLDPKSITANRALATLYLTEGRFKEAESFLKTYVDLSGNIESRFVLADYYVRYGTVAEARKLLDVLVEEEDGYIPASLRLAGLDFAAQKREEAYQRVAVVLKARPGNEATLQAKARMLLIDNRPKEALEVTDALIKSNANSAPSRYLRGVALDDSGALEEAVTSLNEALTMSPGSIPIQARLANVYIKQGKYKEALPLAQQVVKGRPRSPDAHFLYGRALLRTGDIPGAERELLAVEKASPSPEVLSWVGLLYYSKGDVPGARRYFTKALELAPDSIQTIGGLVSLDLVEGKPDQALARIRAHAAKHPDNAELFELSGRAYLAVGDLPNAEAAFLRVMALDENNVDAYGSLAAIYLAQKRLPEARQRFEELARKQSRPASTETMIGTILLQENKPEEARKHFERAIQLDPRAAVAANNLAWDYANGGGNLDVALQLAQTAKAELPNEGAITDTLGWIYYKKGLNSLAVSTLREAVQQSPSNPKIHYRLGLAYLKNGNEAEARATLQHALTLKPTAADAEEVKKALATITS
jgi:tetratricopeptide (TPR) repeat protein